MFLNSCNTNSELALHNFAKINIGNELSLDEMGEAYNYIHFIGIDTVVYKVDKNKDSVNIPYNYIYNPFINRNFKKRKKVLSNQFLIYVDTTNLIEVPYYAKIPNSVEGIDIINWSDTHKKQVVAYPVYIINKLDKSTSIPVRGIATEMIQEAKNENGDWRPIEYRVRNFCGLGYREYILKHNYFVISSIYKYTGNFSTELRIKFRNQNQVFYSNIFNGKINKNQFKLDEYYNSPENFLEPKYKSK